MGRKEHVAHNATRSAALIERRSVFSFLIRVVSLVVLLSMFVGAMEAFAIEECPQELVGEVPEHRDHICHCLHGHTAALFTALTVKSVGYYRASVFPDQPDAKNSVFYKPPLRPPLS